MKTSILIKAFTAVALLLSGTVAVMAQVPIVEVPVAQPVIASSYNLTPQFFVCVLAGVLLALGFQVLLTILSVASGISLIGNIEDKDFSSHKSHDNHHSDHSTPALVKISSGLGIWTIVTVSLALFFASLLAVKLSLIGDNAIGVTLGLVIWATFFTIMVYLEIKSVSTLVGGVFNTALSGIRTSFSAVQGIFGGSKEDKMVNVAKQTVHSIREELASAMDNSHFTKKMDEYVNKLQPHDIDYKRVKKELKDLLTDLEFKEKTEVGEDGLEKRTFIEIAKSQPHLSKKDVQKLSEIYDEVKSAAQTEGSTSDKVMAAVDKLTPGTEEDSRRFREKIETYLRNTGKESLNPDSIKQDLERIISDPKSTKEVITNRVSQFDRSTVVSLLAQRSDLSTERAEQITNYLEKAFTAIKQKFSKQPTSVNASGGQSSQNSGESTNYNRSYDPSTQTEYIKPGSTSDRSQSSTPGSPGSNNYEYNEYGTVIRRDSTSGDSRSANKESIKGKFEDRVRNYFASLNRPEFNYDRIKMDFEQIFHDPKSTFDVLKNRLSQYDRDSLVALLSSNDNISRQDAERMVAKVEEARDSALGKAEKLETEVKMKLQEMKQTALHEAENVRKAAATAAWWLFATAVISGVASALGGMLAITI